jgi:ElaB/YqjD/DUF883 family membrane-anchored ribosome-binding protein
MERNDAGSEGFAAGGQPNANEFSGSGSQSSQASQSSFETSDSQFSATDGGATSTASTTGPQGVRDRAKNFIGNAGDRLADVGSTARERVGTAKDKLANALESGADKLRERAHPAGVTLAGATAEGGSAAISDGRVAQVSDKVAGGMQASADWLREADLDGIKSGIETQVKEHPGRTLLIAAGLGYLIGRAFRNNQ